MKYCKKCGVLYTTDVCPNCGILLEDEQNVQQQVLDKKVVRRQWIALLIGIPAFILAIIAIVRLFKGIV